MRDLVLRLDQVELGQHGRVVGEVALAHRVQALDHVLHALVDGPLVQDRAQPLEDRVERLRGDLGEGGAALGHEGDDGLDRVVRRRLEQQDAELQCEQLVHQLLVDEGGDELDDAVADDLVVPAVGAVELVDGSLDQQLAWRGGQGRGAGEAVAMRCAALCGASRPSLG